MGKNLICGRRKKICLMSILGFVFFSLLFSGCGGSSSNGDGSETAHSGPYSVDGYIQKGPFISGSTIIIQELDDRFNPTGVTYQTTTNDDFGSFALGNYIQSRYVEIIATGFYFNEVSGALSDAAITLRAIADLSMEDRVNVNLLTTLEKNRIIHLIKNENKSFVDAREQAEKEVLGIFNITGADILSFDQLDLSSENQGDAILLAISAIFQGKNSVAELSELLSKINLDIEKDGILDNSMYAAALKESSAGLVFNQIRTNLENRYATLGLTTGIPGFESYARTLVPPTIIKITPKELKIFTDSITPEFNVTFNQEMDKKTITPLTFTLNDGSNSILGIVTYDEDKRKAIFTPSTELSVDKTYTVSFSSDVKSLSGINLGENISWDYYIEKIVLVPIKSNKIAAGHEHTVGLKSDGSVVAVESNHYNVCDVSSWTDIVQISACEGNTVGLKSDGSVVAVGCSDQDHGQCNGVSSWTDIVQISAGKHYTVGLKSDGSAVAVGLNEYGQCDVSSWTDIVQISAGWDHTVGLKSDGSAVAVGLNEYGQCDVSSWTDIVQIDAGYGFTVGLKSDSTVVVAARYYGQTQATNFLSSWTGIVQISAGGGHTVGLKSDSSVVAVGYNYYDQCDVSSWTDIVQISAGGGHTVGLKSDGSVVAVGDNNLGQCNVSSWTGIVP